MRKSRFLRTKIYTRSSNTIGGNLFLNTCGERIIKPAKIMAKQYEFDFGDKLTIKQFQYNNNKTW